MMLRWSFLLPLALFLFPFIAASTNSSETAKDYYPWNPVQFTTPLRSIKPNSKVVLTWRGGSGNGYEVYYIPHYDNQLTYESFEIARTNRKRVRWNTPKASAYPDGTTFIVGVRDVTPGPGSKWYDLTGLLDFVAPMRQQLVFGRDET